MRWPRHALQLPLLWKQRRRWQVCLRAFVALAQAFWVQLEPLAQGLLQAWPLEQQVCVQQVLARQAL